eukprot:TRINITY_DN20767_c0_g1_i1.p1 TRINITY_DN20767_c0_g1~~TRINITY_DN20767_c0_g1_i1.p1  ORF type:complete len:116 (-),score=4.13 TRINITY_DN20767_c0_g1_i1:799-1146(-)
MKNEKNGKFGRVAIILGSITQRFRRELHCFQRYYIETKLLTWDDKAFYLEQRLCNHSTGFVHCIALVKQNIVGASPSAILHALNKAPKTPPPMPDRLAAWVDSDNKSSLFLRPRN